MKLHREEEQDFSISVEDVLSGLQKVKRAGTKQWVALCPSHNDSHQSLSIGATPDGKALLHCHAGCEYIDIIQELGLYQETASTAQKTIVAEYDYIDEQGELVYQVVRFEPKDFRQRRPDGKGGWVYNLKGVIRVLYRLPELMASEGIVFVCEGEKDVHTLTNLGYTATTNSGGAGKWLKEYNKYFRARDVVIIPDNGKTGKEHAEIVSKGIYLTANSVKILELDYRHEKDDITDWLKTHTKEDLDALVLKEPNLVLDEDELEAEVGLPFYMEGELAILGAILRNGKLIHKVIKSEVNKDFYNNKNKIILKAMLECFADKQGIDYITVADKLKQSGRLDYIGGIAFLKSLKEDAPDSINLDDWIKAVEGKADFRRLLEIGKKATKMSQGELDTPENIGDEIFRSTLNIRRKSQKEVFTQVADPVSRIFTEARNLVAGEVTGISTGFKELDDITAGLQRTDFIVLAARPGMGKSALAVNIAYHASKKYKVALFSLEMSKDQLIKRILCSEARVDSTNFRTGNLNEHEWARLANVVPEMEKSQLFIDDTPNLSTVELRSKLSLFTEEQGSPDLVVIDYLQLMRGEGRENRQQEISSISRDLKSLAKELNAPVLALSQFSRAPEARNPPIPLLSDLRESGAIEQDTDVVAFIYREDYYNENEDNKGLAQIIIAKQRNGATGTIDLAFLKKYSRFENLHKVEYGIK